MKKIIFTFLLFVSATIFAQPGKLDSSFSNDGILTSDFIGLKSIKAITLQKNGKMLAAGLGITPYYPLLRFNENGSVDKSFGNNGKLVSQRDEHPTLTGVALQSDEKIIAVGTANISGLYNQAVLYRFTKEGVPDSTFGDNGFAFLSINGKNIDSRTPAVAIQTDDKIVIAGNAGLESFVARFTADGKRDSAFYKKGFHLIALGTFSDFSAIALQPNGKIMVAGSGTVNNASAVALLRFETNGEMDNSFGNQGIFIAPANTAASGTDLKIYANGKIIVAGNSIKNNNQTMLALRVKANGTMDSSFGTNGFATIKFDYSSYASSIAIDGKGSIILAGSADQNEVGAKHQFALARLKSNGKIDNSFGNKGKVTTSFLPNNGLAAAATLQPDGKIIAAGETTNSGFQNLVITRYIGNDNAVSFAKQDQLKSIVNIHPNPVQNVLSIENLSSLKTQLTITNRSGNTIKTTIATEKNFQWNVSDLKAGEYYLTIQNTVSKQSLLFVKE